MGADGGGGAREVDATGAAAILGSRLRSLANASLAAYHAQNRIGQSQSELAYDSWRRYISAPVPLSTCLASPLRDPSSSSRYSCRDL